MSRRNAGSAHFIGVSRISGTRDYTLAPLEAFGYFSVAHQWPESAHNGWTRQGRNMAVILNRIRDPEEGLALLAKRPADPAEETPESKHLRKFWTHVFTEWRDGLAGDTLAFMRALLACSHCHKPPPRGLIDAMIAQASKLMSPAEQRDHAALARHMVRWKAVQAALAEGRSYAGAREAASASLACSDAAGEPRTVRESYEIINDAGGARVSLKSYRRARQHRRNSKTE
jgi:hypothetical protein